MGGILFSFLVIVIIIVVIAKAGNSSTSRSGAANWYDKLVANGIAARGILLQVSTVATSSVSSATSMRRFETRAVFMDIEIPGQDPYDAQVNVFVPSNFARDILPGATVELRIDPKNRNTIVVVGPGAGFSVAALNAALAQDQRAA